MATGRRRLPCGFGALIVLSACGSDLPAATAQNSGADKAQARSAGAPKARLRQASFFVTGDRNPALLDAIRRGMDDEIDFNGHYSIAFVSCGPGCGSYWVVDRQSGGVIAAPASPVEGETTWDIAEEPDSDILKLRFGPRDGIPGGCAEQHFRLSGTAFTAFGRRRPAACPT